MPKLEHQVLKSTLKNPICVAIFDNDGLCGDFVTAQADKLREELNQLRINFAAVDHAPPIMIFIEKEDWPKVERAEVKLPSVLDRR